MSTRRDVVLGLAAFACAAAAPARAQGPDRLRRIGFISLRSGPGPFDLAFRDELRRLGYVEGRSIEMEYSWAAESQSRAEELATRLVARNPDVIVAATTVAIRAAMRATSTIPIVMAAAADPLASGLVANLARPGGNVTGLTLISTETGAKRLQLLRDLVPSAQRAAVLLVERGASDDAAINARLVEQLHGAARHLGISVTGTVLRSPDDIGATFTRMQRDQIQAVFVPVNSVVLDHRARLIDAAARHRMPAIYETEAFISEGGLLSYGPSLVDMYRRAAVYVDRILKGTRPADLPIEQPTVFRMAINLKAARALGLVVSPALLARADQVIE